MTRPAEPNIIEKVGDQVTDRVAGASAGHAVSDTAVDGNSPVGGSIRSATTRYDAGTAAVSRIAAAPSSPSLTVEGGAFLSASWTVRFHGETKDTKLPPSSYVEIVSLGGGAAKVRVYSTFGGKTATVPTHVLHAEPRLGHQDGALAATPRDDNYTRQHGPLWNAAPKIEDIRQGYLGDCYLCAAMGAVCAANPNVIRALFSPTTPDADQYSITLHRRGRDGTFSRHVEVVDAFLPTDNTGNVAYSDLGRAPDDRKVPLWPALIEKAYAQMLGGYDVAGQGGSPTTAMEALTGVAGQEHAVPSSDKDLLALLRGMQGKLAMADASLPPQTASAHGFRQTSPNHFSVQLSAPGGTQPELIPNSVKVSEPTPEPTTAQNVEHRVGSTLAYIGFHNGAVWGQPSVIPTAQDDGKGALTGTRVTGTVDYGKGVVTVAYDASIANVDASKLTVDYTWEGLLDAKLTVYASHAYIFESVGADGLIRLRNPWGVSHPAPMTAADFRRLFVMIYGDQVRQAQTSSAKTRKSS